jgi:hypothetical protein
MDKWYSENFVFQKNVKYDGAGGGFGYPEKFMPKEFETVEYGPLFAYMYRRFGIPQYGSDDLKDIALWYITTPDPAVALRIAPKPSSAIYGYAVDISIYNNRRDVEQVKAVQVAMKSALMDLLRPVFVRDVAINAAGRIDQYENECEAWEWAGYGVPIEYFEEKFGDK